MSPSNFGGSYIVLYHISNDARGGQNNIVTPREKR